MRKEASGGWSQKVKRKCWKSLSCWMRWKALSWTWMAKAVVSRLKQSSLEEREAPNAEGEEIESLKRKVIRVESEETQDYVRKAKGTDNEEEEERSFVPSAISVPQKPLFRCDNQCSEKNSALGSWLRWWSMKVMKHMRPTCVRSVSTNTCRQKLKNRCQMCSGDRWWKRRRIAE